MLPADGKPARSFTVDGQQFESPDGRFELPSVRAGPVRLRIEARGLPPLEHHFRLEAGTDAELAPLRLRAKGAPRRLDPNEQLAALERFGEVPPCRPERRSNSRGRAAPGRSEPPPAPLKRLAGKTAELEAYLDTPYDRVLTRVLAILCAIGDDEAREALIRLQQRHPCPVLWTVGRIEASGATERRGASVDMTREWGPGRSFSTGGTEYRTALAEEIVAWTNQAARERARRISDGDLDAFREALGIRESSIRSPAARRSPRSGDRHSRGAARAGARGAERLRGPVALPFG
ncbi:MAG TPA: hypothetical protein DFS52_29225 [Myxococcales bacterium]|nr:hypothetical protein [Myxococcales bacterium]